MTTKELKDLVNGLLTKDTSKEDIDKIAKINDSIDELDKSIESSKKEYQDLKEDYIAVIRNRNPKNNPADDIDKTAKDDTPKDLNGIIEDVIAKREKK